MMDVGVGGERRWESGQAIRYSDLKREEVSVGEGCSEVGRGTREHGVEGTAKTMSAQRRAQTRRRARGYPTMNKMG